MPKLILNEMRGINTVTANLKMPPAENPLLQNIRSRPFSNYHKRNGIRPISSQSTAVLGIYEFDFDEIIVPVFQSSDTLKFYPSIADGGGSGGGGGGDDADGMADTTGISSEWDISSNAVSLPDPSPYPNSPNQALDPYADYVLIYLIEPLMRRLNELAARGLAIGGYTDWPARIYDSSGAASALAVPTRTLESFYTTGGATAVQWPPNGFYGPDLFWHDIKNNNAPGTYAAVLVNLIRARFVTGGGTASTYATQVIANYFESVSGTTWNGFTYTNVFVAGTYPAAATTGTFRTCFALMKQATRRMTQVGIGLSISVDTVASSDGSVSGRNGANWTQALSCALSKFPTTGHPFYDAQSGCVGAGSDITIGVYGLGIMVRGIVPAPTHEASLGIHNATWTITNGTNLKNVNAFYVYGYFTRPVNLGGGTYTYFAPSAFGSPATSTYVIIASNQAASVTTYTLTTAAIQADMSAIAAAATDPTAAEQVRGWILLGVIANTYFNWESNI